MVLWGLGDGHNVMGSRKVKVLSGAMGALTRDFLDLCPEDGSAEWKRENTMDDTDGGGKRKEGPNPTNLGVYP
jgi:hypothetical protein